MGFGLYLVEFVSQILIEESREHDQRLFPSSSNIIFHINLSCAFHYLIKSDEFMLITSIVLLSYDSQVEYIQFYF